MPFVDARLKLSAVAVTVRLTVVEVWPELVGVMVICVGPEGAMLAAVEIVTTVDALFVPSKLTLWGLKLQVAPAGKPVQLLGLKFTTMPVEPAMGEMVMVEEVEFPAETEAGFKAVADIWKSGVAAARKRAFTSTDPRPVTRL